MFNLVPFQESHWKLSAGLTLTDSTDASDTQLNNGTTIHGETMVDTIPT